MRTSIWPEDVNAHQMSDWLAELRGDSRDEAPGDARAEPSGGSGSWPEALAAAAASEHASPVEASARAEAAARDLAKAGVPAEAIPPNETRLDTETGARNEARAQPRTTGRAVIGDQLKIPIVWCELGCCISWHGDPAALGEADIRARAIRAGWRVDALGRMACPRCQQTTSGFWTTCPVRLWDRNAAMTMVAWIATTRSDTAGAYSSDSRHLAGGRRSANASRPGRHRRNPAAKTAPADRQGRSTAASASVPTAGC